MSACLPFLRFFLSAENGLENRLSGPDDFFTGEEEQPALARVMLAIKTMAGPAVLSKDTGIFSRQAVGVWGLKKASQAGATPSD